MLVRSPNQRFQSTESNQEESPNGLILSSVYYRTPRERGVASFTIVLQRLSKMLPVAHISVESWVLA